MRNKKAVLIVLFSALVLLAAFPGSRSWAANVVANGKIIKVQYTLTVDGKVIDSSLKRGTPLQFKVGAHQVVPGFEKALIGMKIGEKKSFKVSPEEGYGPVNPNAIRAVPKNKLPKNIKPVTGMVLYTRTPSGQVVPVKVIGVKKKSVTIDFNNPLAGKTLNFKVKVVDIK
ncbi:MAG: peptidylprolyl isomerase [Nitrospiraceae bacterium]|nr:peptidylprolyl isomerase [Nitrospiraceae bacterium]